MAGCGVIFFFSVIRFILKYTRKKSEIVCDDVILQNCYNFVDYDPAD